MGVSALRLVIVSPERTIFDGEVELVSVPGVLGAFTILPHHAPIISALTKGDVHYVVAGSRHKYAIQGGFIEMKNNEVSICVE